MGNKTNLDQWATMERMRFIERSAWWRGVVNRQDLARVFGLSLAQASSDLQEYQRVNPGSLNYNLNKKRYEGAENLKLKFIQPVLEEAMALFLHGGSAALPLASGLPSAPAESGENPLQVRVLPMPVRRASPRVERCIFLALLHGMRVRVKYFSVHSGTDEWRWTRPGCFVNDGNRWHVRAWCEKNGEWRDFTLSRMSAADWPAEPAPAPQPDERSMRTTSLRLRANQSLPEDARRGVESDFAMADGVLDLPVPESMQNYLCARLGLSTSEGDMPVPLLEHVQG